jgi:glycerol-3-phosphate dehydrogenase (NAD(P)+)
MTSIAVIGAGSWGTALACLLAEKGHGVNLWVYEEDLLDRIRRTKSNDRFLPGILLPDGVRPFHDLKDAFSGAEIILNAVPAQFTREVFSGAKKYIPADSLIVSASKGIEKMTLMTVSQILKECTGNDSAVLSGPSFAKEVIRKLPTAVTLACKDDKKGKSLQKIFSTDYFRVYTNRDVTGVELGGALKNVMAIASGISDGLALGSSARAALITRGLAEIIRLGVAMGADEKTFSGLSGMGDLVLTCTGVLSRNYSVGLRLGRGESLSEILSGMSMIAEGVDTSESAYQLSVRHAVEMPVVEQVYRAIHENKPPAEAVRELMQRSLKSED